MKVARPGTRQAVPHHIPPKLAPCLISYLICLSSPMHSGASVHRCIIHVQSLNQVNTQHHHQQQPPRTDIRKRTCAANRRISGIPPSIKL
jgi:hypothetical protein